MEQNNKLQTQGPLPPTLVDPGTKLKHWVLRTSLSRIRGIKKGN